MDLAPVREALAALQEDSLPKGSALPVCPALLRVEIRHVARNCEIECPEHDFDADDCPGSFGRYAGEHVAALINAIPGLLAEIDRLKETTTS